MYKYYFSIDYSEGAHPSIIDLLSKTNLEQEPGYGEDKFCEQAKGLIKKALGGTDPDIHFVTSGTQANMVVLSSILRPYESVIAPESSHINVHETGAIEATGHKINLVTTLDGKLTVDMIRKVVEEHNFDQMVKPRVVHLTHPTELGTIYNKTELINISKYCHENGLYVYIDGARLAMAIESHDSDLTLPEISKLVDVFYIGGTKNGALIGEAIVINNNELKENFRYHMRQRGALLSKGRVLGIQFVGLFTDDLYFKLAKHANDMATKLSEAIKGFGFGFLTTTQANQVFPVLPNDLISKLEKMYAFFVWSKVNENHSSVRLVTSWATKETMVEEFIKDLQKLIKK